MEMATNITKRKGGFYLRKYFDGIQREISLGTDKEKAGIAASQFIVTASKTDYETALAELRGVPVRTDGETTFDDMESNYRKYCAEARKAPRPQTIKHNLARLKLVMTRCEFETIQEMERQSREIASKWFDGKQPSETQERTFTSLIGAAASVFKADALKFYASKGKEITNPFSGVELVRPEVTKYVQIPAALREAIYNDCQTELAPHDAMIVLLALGAGLRRSEIEAALPAWFSKQSDHVVITIKESGYFKPKAGKSGTVEILPSLYDTLLKLRGETDSKWFVPSASEKETTGRIWERVKAVNHWLQKKGMTDTKPLHALRKEFGSIVAKTQGVEAAAEALRNTLPVAIAHYVGKAGVKPVDIAGSFKPDDPLEAAAKQLGVTVEQLKAAAKAAAKKATKRAAK